MYWACAKCLPVKVGDITEINGGWQDYMGGTPQCYSRYKDHLRDLCPDECILPILKIAIDKRSVCCLSYFIWYITLYCLQGQDPWRNLPSFVKVNCVVCHFDANKYKKWGLSCGDFCQNWNSEVWLCSKQNVKDDLEATYTLYTVNINWSLNSQRTECYCFKNVSTYSQI